VKKLPPVSTDFKPKARLSVGSKPAKGSSGAADDAGKRRRWSDEEVENLKKGVEE
jgi:hypothetical protein